MDLFRKLCCATDFWNLSLGWGNLAVRQNECTPICRMHIRRESVLSSTLPLRTYTSDDASAFRQALNASGNTLHNASVFTGAYAHQPSCISNAVSGVVQGGTVGAAYGSTVYFLQRDGNILRATGSAVWSGISFAAWYGTFRGSFCALARIRGHRDLADAAAAGGIAGAVQCATIAALHEKPRQLRSVMPLVVPVSALIGAGYAHFFGR